MTAITYLAVRRPFTVEVADATARSVIEAALTDLRCTSRNGHELAPVRYWIQPDDDGWYAIGRDEATLRATTNLEGALGTLLWDINQQALASAGAGLVLHAAAVSIDGVGVLLPGVSGAGKSSLAASLVRRGADYLSDELAIIATETGTVRSYPKPITLEHGAAQHFAEFFTGPIDLIEEHLAATALRAHRMVPDAPVRLIVFPRFRGSGPTRRRVLGPADSLAQLSANVMRPRDASSLPALARLVEDCRCSVLDYADLERAGDLVHEALEGKR